jgi:hypothetical protein
MDTILTSERERKRETEEVAEEEMNRKVFTEVTNTSLNRERVKSICALEYQASTARPCVERRINSKHLSTMARKRNLK